MLRHAVTVPKVVAVISAFGVILLLLALSSRTDSTRITTLFRSATGSKSNNQLADRLNLADKIWSQAVEDRKKMVDHVGLDRDFPDGYVNPFNVWDFARPSFTCPHELERVGKLGDGGKVVCGMSRYEKESPGPSAEVNVAPEMVIYSLGVNRDSSFEAAMLERTNAQIWGYDFSVDSWAKDISGEFGSRAHFSKVGIGKETDKKHDPPFFSVQDLMKLNGHTYVDIVKMDIEGAEFDAMTSFIEHTIAQRQGNELPVLPFGQLLIEIHFFTDRDQLHIPRKLEPWMEWWSSLEQLGLRPVNNEGNWVGDQQFGKPRFMEVSCCGKHLVEVRAEEKSVSGIVYGNHFQLQFPDAAAASSSSSQNGGGGGGLEPKWQVMNTFTQRVEEPDRAFQYLLVAAEPYETVGFKIPARELDKRGEKQFSYLF